MCEKFEIITIEKETKDLVKAEDINELEEIKKKIKDFKDGIDEINKIKEINESFQSEIKNNFKNSQNFETKLNLDSSQIKINNILKFSHEKNNVPIENHGSGFEKILSTILNIKIIEKLHPSKKKIILIDELENSLFYIYQLEVIVYLNKLIHKKRVEKIIMATHSPNIIRIEPNSSIIKLEHNKQSYYSIKEKEFYQNDLSTAFFTQKFYLLKEFQKKYFMITY